MHYIGLCAMFKVADYYYCNITASAEAKTCPSNHTIVMRFCLLLLIAESNFCLLS